MAVQAERQTLAEVIERLVPIVGVPRNFPVVANRGAVGHHLEDLMGIPRGPACLDCADGEVKTFPVKRTTNGTYVPKETIAVTMLNNNGLLNTDFAQSRCCIKLTRTLYIPYYREEEIITYLRPTLIDLGLPEYANLRETLENDYNSIRGYLQTNENLDGSSVLGTYLQNRTKGQGGDAPRTRAFYLRPAFMSEFVIQNF